MDLALPGVLPVLNRPLLHWTLELLARHGFTDLVVNLHHRSTSVREAIGDGRIVARAPAPGVRPTATAPRRGRARFAGEPAPASGEWRDAANDQLARLDRLVDSILASVRGEGLTGLRHIEQELLSSGYEITQIDNESLDFQYIVLAKKMAAE